MEKSIFKKKIRIRDLLIFILIITVGIVLFNLMFIYVRHHDYSIPGEKCTFLVNKITRNVHGTITYYCSYADDCDTKENISEKLSLSEYKKFKKEVKKLKNNPDTTVGCTRLELIVK